MRCLIFLKINADAVSGVEEEEQNERFKGDQDNLRSDRGYCMPHLGVGGLRRKPPEFQKLWWLFDWKGMETERKGGMREILDFFDKMKEELGEDFANTNVFGEKLEIDDYLDEQVPWERVLRDRERCLKKLDEYFAAEKDLIKRELAVVMYCNFQIRYGMTGRMEKEGRVEAYDGLEALFDGLESGQQNMRKLYTAVKTQDFAAFDRILQIHKDSVAAKIYQFVRMCSDYCWEIGEKSEGDVEAVIKYEKMWMLYESMPAPWKEYILGEGELIKRSGNYAVCDNLLPYVQMISMKEILMEYIPQYYGRLLDLFEISRDTKAGEIHNEFRKRSGLGTIDSYVTGASEGFEKQTEKEQVCRMVEISANLLELYGQSLEKLNRQEVMVNTQCLLEKLHYLLNDNEEQQDWSEETDLLKEIPFSEMAPAVRCAYLHIPVRAPGKRPLFDSHYMAFSLNREVVRNTTQKREMMDYYAHSWKHIAYPQTVKEVAEELAKTNLSMANRLMKAYHSEKTLQRSIQLLQYINSGNEKEVSNAFRNGIALSGRDTAGAQDLKAVLSESLDLVVFKILMTESDDSSKMEVCRRKWGCVRSMEELREKYVRDFLEEQGGGGDIVFWVNENLLPVSLSIDGEWERVRFKKESFTVNQFKEILVEIFTNVFLHGESYMRISFESHENRMEIVVENGCGGEEAANRKGLSTMETVLDSINFGAGLNRNSVERSLENGIYRICICFDQKLMMKRGR